MYAMYEYELRLTVEAQYPIKREQKMIGGTSNQDTDPLGHVDLPYDRSWKHEAGKMLRRWHTVEMDTLTRFFTRVRD